MRFTYDDEGRMTSMTTYRDESGPGDTTAWLYDPATGLLVQKLYDDVPRRSGEAAEAGGKGPSYTYTPDGKLATRTWARGVATTYPYDGWGSAPSEARRFLRGGSPRRARTSHPLVPSVGTMEEESNPNEVV